MDPTRRPPRVRPQPEFAAQSKVLAANQGLYNGLLAAGLIWGLRLGSRGLSVKVFFLGCVLVASMCGGMTASRKILWIQALAAAAGLLLLLSLSISPLITSNRKGKQQLAHPLNRRCFTNVNVNGALA